LYELVREQPYIANNIALTRQAYGLDRVSLREFPAETDVAAADPANSQATLQNIRLWDWHAGQETSLWPQFRFRTVRGK
jgi:uncharacterized membrane protein (UPF0182 family)